MSQATPQRIDKNSRRRIPLVCRGIILIWIEEPCVPLSLSEECKEIYTRINALRKYHTIRCTNVSRCIRFVKRARSYERIIVVLITCRVPTADFSELSNCKQVQSVLIVTPDKTDNNNIPDNNIKQTYVFSDCQFMFVKLQKMVDEDLQISNEDGLTIINQREKALRDVRQDLGPFVWSHSYIGLSFLFKLTDLDADHYLG